MLRHQLLEQLGGRLLDVHLGVRLEVVGELRRERSVGGHGNAPRGVAQEEAPRPMHRLRLGELAEGRRRRAVPDVEHREARLAVLADLERHLGGRRCLSQPKQARGRRGEVVEPQPLELLEQLGVLVAEREQEASVAGLRRPSPARRAARPGASVRGSGRARRAPRPCRRRASGPSRSATRAPPGWARDRGSARAAPRSPSRRAAARARATACAASRTSARAAP